MKQLVFAVLFVCAAPNALAEKLPTDAELRSAYCLTVLKTTLQEQQNYEQELSENVENLENGRPAAGVYESIPLNKLQEMLASVRQGLSVARSAQNRLQLYLVPRLQYLDSFSILGASKRAETDLKDLDGLSRTPLFQQCVTKCFTGQAEGDTCLNKCLGPTNAALRARITSCSRPTWLPF